MPDFYRGIPYRLIRVVGRPIELVALTSRSGKHWEHTLFRIGRRADSKYGRMTVPKIRHGFYLVERSDGGEIPVKIYRVCLSPLGRLVFARRATNAELS